ncbi:GNAT family N-acetyltransferase [Thalassobellus suaedae]|uniref:GNAT family N-acetyltransferase n=1 Tax=Thalassobellus suaedae TaxID=3074124 RepID=A0ABY9Y282_9FLAO|nr:GNAT family N-acetyltransferase [Flavobacteriaceae bacterium HL-DH10]
MSKVYKKDFYNTFFLKNNIPNIYKNIRYSYRDGDFYINKKKQNNTLNKVSIVNLFPNYFYANHLQEKKNIKKSIVQTKLNGYAVKLEDFLNIDSYLKSNFKSNTKSSIVKRKNRLESCFNVNYKMYFGEILNEDYERIMVSLKNMLYKRFLQKKATNEFFDKWESYYSSTIKLILNKEASLFVIYANNIIIGLSLNYHAKDIFIGHVIAYDINYSKFGIGNTIVFKLIEWCINNNYSILDMGNGDLDYKLNWSNYIYNYQYHIVYRKNSINSILKAYYAIFIIKLKNLLKNCNADIYLALIKKKLLNNTIKENTFSNIKLEKVNKLPLSNLQETNYTDFKNESLTKSFIDFVYLEQEYVSNIRTYKINERTYYYKSKSKIQKVELQLFNN